MIGAKRQDRLHRQKDPGRVHQPGSHTGSPEVAGANLHPVNAWFAVRFAADKVVIDDAEHHGP